MAQWKAGKRDAAFRFRTCDRETGRTGQSCFFESDFLGHTSNFLQKLADFPGIFILAQTGFKNNIRLQ